MIEEQRKKQWRHGTSLSLTHSCIKELVTAGNLPSGVDVHVPDGLYNVKIDMIIFLQYINQPIPRHCIENLLHVDEAQG